MAGVKDRKAAQIAAMEAAKPKENGNVFEGSGDFKKQFVFFSENLSRNGFYRGFSEDEVCRVEEMLENITFGMDSLNKVSINRNVMTEISHEAAELELISSVNALTYFADKYVPEEIRDSFLETVNQYKSYNSQIVAAHKNIYDLRDESMAEIPLPNAKNVSAAVKKTQEDTRASREIGKVKHTKEQEEEHKREYQSYFDRLVQGKESPETVFDSLQNVLVNYASGGSKNSHVLAMLNSRNYGAIQNMCCYWSKLLT